MDWRWLRYSRAFQRRVTWLDHRKNLVHNESASAGDNTLGIWIMHPQNGVASSHLYDCLVMNNTIRHTGIYGIDIPNLLSVRVIGNHVEDTRGIRMQGKLNEEWTKL